ncbi:unnamed protein product, partial [Protopolystoma xenopodis]
MRATELVAVAGQLDEMRCRCAGQEENIARLTDEVTRLRKANQLMHAKVDSVVEKLYTEVTSRPGGA